MHGLRELQEQFAQALFDDGPGLPDVVADAVAGRGAFDAGRRFGIHRNNVAVTLRGALAVSYPCVHRLVGEAFFARLARDFARAVPPSEPNLDLFGADLAGFLAHYVPVAHLAYLPDVARLEWARVEAWRSADPAPFDHEGLAAVSAGDQPRLSFVPSPSMRLVASHYPLLAIREFCLSENEPQGGLRLDAGGDLVLVLRRGERVELHRLAPAEHAFLDALARGQTLAAAWDVAAAVQPDFDGAACLQRHVVLQTLDGWRRPHTGGTPGLEQEDEPRVLHR